MHKKHVILVVGSTGTGKSEFGKALGLNTIASDTPNSVTQNTELYIVKDFEFIDTGGFDDSNQSMTDEDRQTQVFEYLNQIDRQYITTVLWFCNPNVRMTNMLQEQAAFISSIAANDTALGGNVWKNVIIIVKKGDDIQGPKEAAQQEIKKITSQEINPPVLPFWIMELDADSRRFYGRLNKDERHKAGRYYRSEIRDLYDKLTEGHPKHPIHILFLNERCINCKETGKDKRIMRRGCHGSRKKVHPAQWIMRHSMAKEHTCQAMDDEDSVQRWKSMQDEIKRLKDKVNEENYRNLLKIFNEEKTHYEEIKNAETFTKRKFAFFEFTKTAVTGTATGTVTGAAVGGLVAEIQVAAACITGSIVGAVCGVAAGSYLIYKFYKSYKSSLPQFDKTKPSPPQPETIPSIPSLPKVHQCCKRHEGHEGCQYSCCKQGEDSEGCEIFWPCCKRIGENAEGCKEVCSKCKEDTRLTEGCDKDIEHITMVIRNQPECQPLAYENLMDLFM